MNSLAYYIKISLVQIKKLLFLKDSPSSLLWLKTSCSEMKSVHNYENDSVKIHFKTKFIITEIVIFHLQKIIYYFNVIPYHQAWFAAVDVLQNSSFLRWLLCVVCTSSMRICIILWNTTCFWTRVLVKVLLADCSWCAPRNHKA